MEDINIFDNDDNKVNIINNPFIKDCITGIVIRYSKMTFFNKDNHIFTGYVEFSNGNTKGTQEFKGNNLVDVFIQIKDFCEKL